MQLLGTPVSAQYLRIIPLEFNIQAGLRFEVLGCTPDCKNTITSSFEKQIGLVFMNMMLLHIHT